MIHTFHKIPFWIIAVMMVAAMMCIPVIYAVFLENWLIVRTFLNTAILLGILCALLSIATLKVTSSPPGHFDILILLMLFFLLPLIMAIPFYEAAQTPHFIDAYTEMVSAFTTTGATVYAPGDLHPVLHLWRALCAWFGGLFMWVCAAAIFLPLSIGGYEITRQGGTGRDLFGNLQLPPLTVRMLGYFQYLAPLYIGLTGILCVLLLLGGNSLLSAVVLSMSTLSTSGITLDGGYLRAGWFSEIFIFLFFIFAFSRTLFDRSSVYKKRVSLWHNPEIRLAIIIIIVSTLVLFGRQITGGLQAQTLTSAFQVFKAFWGYLFSTTSFLSTTGFISSQWGAAANWSGLPTPGLILMALALIGGGVATTAGGVKLLRLYTLFRFGMFELEKMISPNIIGKHNNIQRRGVYITWVFFMLFVIFGTFITIGFAVLGASFETAILYTTAALSNTGPLVLIAGQTPTDFLTLSDPAKVLLSLAMIAGRLETLVIFAFLNLTFWRL